MNQRSEEPVEQVQQQKSEYKLIGSLRPERGHTVFEVNQLTGEIKPAEIIYEDTVDYNKALRGDYSKKGRINKRDNCIYVSALNKRNVKKILNR